MLPISAAFVLFYAIMGCKQGEYQQGERLYKANCANCHMDRGEGLGALMPPLAGADYLEKNRESLACIVRLGLKDSIQVNGKWYDEQMPAAKHLSDVQVTNILNYVLTSWGNAQPPLRLDEVRESLKACE